MDNFERAEQLAAEQFGPAVELAHPTAPVPKKSGEGSWYRIPDRPSSYHTGLSPLLLSTSNSVPVSIESLSFDSINGVWHPDEISALASYIAAACLWDEPSDGEARQTAMMYLTGFLVYYLFNVDTIPKFYSEE